MMRIPNNFFTIQKNKIKIVQIDMPILMRRYTTRSLIIIWGKNKK